MNEKCNDKAGAHGLELGESKCLRNKSIKLGTNSPFLEAEPNNDQQKLFATIRQLIMVVVILVLALVGALFYLIKGHNASANNNSTNISISPAAETKTGIDYWEAPRLSSITDPARSALVKYGADLIAHTAKYLGPEGSILQISNGMNCQNCHLDAGTKIYGNNFGSVASTYPSFKPRSGIIESTVFRVNDCLKRSMNGKPLDSLSQEMKAITAYFDFLGEGVPKGKKVIGSGLKDLPYLDRAADPGKGKVVFLLRCQVCHGENGQGQKLAGEKEYLFPPLWGDHSYNDGAGIFRISSFAKYVKYNMPKGTVFDAPVLSDEEAWDVAAFVNSQPRPHYDNKKDWPDISKKPADYPFGPFKDSFSETQHKYGPFPPIIAAQKKQATK